MYKKLLFLLPLLFLVGCTPDEVSISLEPGHDTVTVFEDYTPEGCIITINDESFDMVITNNPVDTDTIGTYMIDYEYDDYTCQRAVFVVDNVAPEGMLLYGVDTIHKGDEWVDPGVDAVDNYSDVEISVTYPIGYSTDFVGSYTIIYTLTDEAGNVTEIPRVVHVIE
ncbi:DUF5011 domain-containing protein [Candidatus Xianfuyuplasma coldseepsis]|uniref:DUF5011 domain-containing protein n=1 Tax=Candidatus Xianfuyuplasma coldseepsis TaxID=2782163 RepID=A0A7L7KT19_9MOLU|nr:DUF5011 domain-containing protein [Xianfuyuplasma coldseepsis]QMS85094.1 DUF5011 domain-containing protein [Xianfuyuplasma coldseepsis]